MKTININIEDQLIHEIGIKSVKEFIEHQLSLLRFKYLGEMISETIRQSGINHRQEVEEARQEAWNDYKTQYLQDRQ